MDLSNVMVELIKMDLTLVETLPKPNSLFRTYILAIAKFYTIKRTSLQEAFHFISVEIAIIC
jgi:hypothetical protein